MVGIIFSSFTDTCALAGLFIVLFTVFTKMCWQLASRSGFCPSRCRMLLCLGVRHLPGRKEEEAWSNFHAGNNGLHYPRDHREIPWFGDIGRPVPPRGRLRGNRQLWIVPFSSSPQKGDPPTISQISLT